LGSFENRDTAFKRLMDIWVTHQPNVEEAK